MTHNHSLFRSLCTQRWTRACSLSPEAPSFWLAFQARPALCMHVFVKVQCSTLGSTLEDKCFSFFSTDWRWQWWRTSNSAVTAFIAKRPRVAYSCSYVLLPAPMQDELLAWRRRYVELSKLYTSRAEENGLWFLNGCGLSGLVLLDAGDTLRCVRRCGWLFFSFLFFLFLF